MNKFLLFTFYFLLFYTTAFNQNNPVHFNVETERKNDSLINLIIKNKT